MRAIDADALREQFPEPEDWRDPERALVHITGIWAEIDNAPTIELRCEKCETFNKTRLLVPQPEREKGEWTKGNACEFCGFQPWYEGDIHTLSYCPNCGSDMREDQDDQSKR